MENIKSGRSRYTSGEPKHYRLDPGDVHNTNLQPIWLNCKWIEYHKEHGEQLVESVIGPIYREIQHNSKGFFVELFRKFYYISRVNSRDTIYFEQSKHPLEIAACRRFRGCT